MSVRTGLQDGGVGGGRLAFWGRTLQAAEVLRQTNADHPDQWQGEAEKAPPPTSGCSRPRQVANSFPRLPLSRRRAETPCALEYPFVQ